MLFTIGEIIKLTRSLQGHSSAVYSCQFSPNFEHIITGLVYSVRVCTSVSHHIIQLMRTSKMFLLDFDH